MSVAWSWWQPYVVSFLPGHRLSRPDLEVLTVALHLLSVVGLSVAREVGQSSEEDDITAGDVESMSVARIWRDS